MPLEQKFISYKREYFLQVAKPNTSHIFWEVYKIIYCLPFPLLYNVETTVTLFFSHFLGWKATTSKSCTWNNRRLRNSNSSTSQTSAVVRKVICWGWLASSESLWPCSAGHHRSSMQGLASLSSDLGHWLAGYVQCLKGRTEEKDTNHQSCQLFGVIYEKIK